MHVPHRSEQLNLWTGPGRRCRARSEEATSVPITRQAFDCLLQVPSVSCALSLPTGHPSLSSARLSPSLHLQAVRSPPRGGQTLTLAWSKSTTQTHRVAKVSASVLAVHQGGPLLQQSQTSRAAKAGEGHLWEDACASGSSVPCGHRLRGTTA